jgi:hypothetical protein
MASPYTYTPYSPTTENFNAYMQQNFNPNLQIGQTGNVVPNTVKPAAAQTSTATTAGFNPNPAPQAGQGAYGRVPGPTPVPPSTFTQTAGVYPGLKQQAGQVSSNVMGELQGVLSPETINMIQQHAAEFGVSSGMPLSEFSGAAGLRSLGLATEQLQQQGEQGYLSALSGIGQAQLNPALLAQIATQNAQLAAAPDPEMAAKQLLSTYQNSMRGYGGGPTFNPPPIPAYGPNTDPMNPANYVAPENLTDQPAIGALPNALTPEARMPDPNYPTMSPVAPMYYTGYSPTQAYAPNAEDTGLTGEVFPYGIIPSY